MKRIYLLNNERIESSSVAGFIHKARADKPFPCLDCEKQILKGQKWVEWNSPFHSEFYWHLDCYLESHGETILGVRIEKRILNNFGKYIKANPKRYPWARPFVICERFQSPLIKKKEDKNGS